METPLGVSWYVLEKWVSGRGIRDERTDTRLSCHSRMGSCDVEDPGSLSDEALDRLCAELDIVSPPGRDAQLAALHAPVISTGDVQRLIVMPLCAPTRGPERRPEPGLAQRR